MTTCQIAPMYRGDTPTLRITATNPDGTPYSLTGHTIWVTAKRSKADLDAAAVFQLSTTEGNVTVLGAPDDNQADAVPPSADTSGLTADVQVYIGVRIKTPGGRVYTIFEGTLPIIAGTTQAS